MGIRSRSEPRGLSWARRVLAVVSSVDSLLRFGIASLIFLAFSLTFLPNAHAGDPYLHWWTIETPHARVHYEKNLEPIAERVADRFEQLVPVMTQQMGWSPSSPTDIVLTDTSDSANGSATAFPYTVIRLYVTSPDDMSALADYDDWYLGLVSHENTHILHMDQISGVPALINAVLGRTLVPNQAQPRWLLEGYAVVNETRFASGGRLRSSMFDMFLRADVLDNRIMTLDQMSNSPFRWPYGNVWYVYGAYFLQWIVDTYGYGTLQAVAADTSAQVLPWAVNRSVRRATGRTYEQLYPAWVAYLRDRYAKQVAAVRRRGLRRGVHLTHQGGTMGRPRFIPLSARSSRDGYAQLLFHQDDGNSRAGLYRMTLDDPLHKRQGQHQLVVRTVGAAVPSFAPDGSLFYTSSEPWRNNYSYFDLHRIPSTKWPSPDQEDAKRITFGRRVRSVDISPTGRQIVFTANHQGTSFLRIASLGPDGQLDHERTLVPSIQFEQAYTPRFSPDGTQIVYSAWTRGGYRDIRLVDVATGRFVSLMHDRAVDRQPVFSPNGRYILFSSDRTGIANIYAFDVRDKSLHQVTNVLTGAYQPELSPDGKTLVYVSYSSRGYDLQAMRFEPSHFLPALPYHDTHPLPATEAPRGRYAKHPYNPLPSLRPRALSFRIAPGTFGQTWNFEAKGSDAVGLHGVHLGLNLSSQETMPYVGLSYSYGGLPFVYSATVFRSMAPKRGYKIGGKEPTWTERTIGLTNRVVYGELGAMDVQRYALSYSIARSDGTLPVGTSLDPYGPVGVDPPRGNIGVMRLAWAFSNAESYSEGVGAERGVSVGASADVADTFLASDYRIYAFGYQARAYLPAPWGRHHVFALHAGGAVAAGDYPKRGAYYVGGFGDTKIEDLINNSFFQGSFVIRGYPPVSAIGNQYHLFNAEYRFPIARIDRGLSTLPIYLRRLNGNAFIDYGGAFNDLDLDDWRGQFHTGVGGELWAEVQLGYYMVLNLRIGYGKGFGRKAEPGGQTYFVIASPF